jgi:hypothetical protein
LVAGLRGCGESVAAVAHVVLAVAPLVAVVFDAVEAVAELLAAVGALLAARCSAQAWSIFSISFCTWESVMSPSCDVTRTGSSLGSIFVTLSFGAAAVK